MCSTHPCSERTGCRMTCGALLGGASGVTSGDIEVTTLYNVSKQSKLYMHIYIKVVQQW